MTKIIVGTDALLWCAESMYKRGELSSDQICSIRSRNKRLPYFVRRNMVLQ